MRRVFVVNTSDNGWPIPGVFDELQKGRARIGWSSEDDQDLRRIETKILEGAPLNQYQQAAKRCRRFLTNVKPDDYLLYPHQPERGKFCVVEVTGEYGYSSKEEGLGGNWRSFRPCAPLRPQPIDMYDEIVSAQLRNSLGRPGRFYEPTDPAPFLTFLDELPEAGRLQDDSNRASLRRIHNELRKELPDAIRREFANADLSRKFCPVLFERMGYSVVVQECPAEAGTDVVVTIGSPLLLSDVEIRIGVQVFAWEGTVDEEGLKAKLEQLLAGWEENGLCYGALLTTGRCSEAAQKAVRRHNKEVPDRLVRLIDGEDLAELFLQHFPPGDR